MNLFGIGPLELILILLIALIVLGPQDMIKTGKRLGTGLRKLFNSDLWQQFKGGLSEVRSMSQKVFRDPQIENDIQKVTSEIYQIKGSIDEIKDNLAFTGGDNSFKSSTIKSYFDPEKTIFPRGQAVSENSETNTLDEIT
jgi:Sec-independent protein translocase protein TatA